MILGTIGYMAPEQARGEAVAAEADVFSLGVVLYELVTGRHPFMAASQLGTLNALLWETPEPPSLLNPELPRALDQLILESLQKDRRLRPGASEVMYRLALAHDSNIATALSAVTVSTRRLSASTNVVGREDELAAMNHEFDRAHRGKARHGRHLRRSGVGKTTLVEAFVSRARGTRRAGRASAAAGAPNGSPAARRTCRCSRRSRASSGASSSAASRASSARSRRAGTRSSCRPTENDSSAARLAAETAGGSQERLKREIASLLEEAGRMQPIVLWFDDVHWADPSTTDLLGYPGETARQHAAAHHRHRTPVGAGAVAPSVPVAEARSAGPWALPRDRAVVSERSRHRAVHRAPVSRTRVSARLRRTDSRSHRRQPALHGRRAARSAAAAGHPAAGRPVDDRRRTCRRSPASCPNRCAA